MGNLLRILSDKGASSKADLYLDFEEAQPTDAERPVYEKVSHVLERAPAIIDELRQYEGAGNEIRQAISSPSSEEHQQQAWQAVCPLVLKLKNYHEFSTEIETIFPQLLQALCNGDEPTLQRLEANQALAKQLAEVLHFVLSFDDLKMTNPAIQNDFSYYRRTQNRVKMSADADDISEVVNSEVANRMSLFYACPTPMLKTISDATTKFIEENRDFPIENTTDCLSTLANLCRAMIENPSYRERFKNNETVLFCLRVMVGVIILYDYTHPQGAFVKKSTVDVRQSVKVLKDVQAEGGPNTSTIQSLLNALRYTTKHLNDETTPRQIKQMLSGD